jgi:hypothetical protein
MESKKPTVATCKFLGLKTDPRSLASYPSGANCCYGCLPENTPDLVHQREFCLAEKHQECPVFTAESPIPMPAEFAHKVNGKSKGGLGFWPAIILIGVLLGLVAAIVLVLPGYLNPQPAPDWGTPSEPAPAVEETPTPIATEIQATDTPAPSPTPTVEPSPTQPLILLPLQTELGTEYKVVIHRIGEGDNISSLGQRHKSWDQAILDATYNLVPPLKAGQLVVIPVNNRNWSNQPPLEPYQVSQPAITLDDLAQILGVDATLLKYYNGYEGYLIQQGSWIVIPRAP